VTLHHQDQDQAPNGHHEGGYITVEPRSELNCHSARPWIPEVTIFVKTLLPSASVNNPYLELGLRAVLDSGGSQVLALGGGQGIRLEYELYNGGGGDNCGVHDDECPGGSSVKEVPWLLMWHAWLLDRTAATEAAAGGEGAEQGGGRREACYFQEHFDRASVTSARGGGGAPSDIRFIFK
jgi:hypothetical protein